MILQIKIVSKVNKFRMFTYKETDSITITFIILAIYCITQKCNSVENLDLAVWNSWIFPKQNLRVFQ